MIGKNPYAGGRVDYFHSRAAALLLSEYHRKPGVKRIRFVGLDTEKAVLDAIRDGSIDMTLAQNPFGHGYISCALLDLMLQGWTPKMETCRDGASLTLSKSGR